MRIVRRRVATAAGAILLRPVALAFAKAGDVVQHLPLVVTPAIFALVIWLTLRERLHDGLALPFLPRATAAERA